MCLRPAPAAAALNLSSPAKFPWPLSIRKNLMKFADMRECAGNCQPDLPIVNAGVRDEQARLARDQNSMHAFGGIRGLMFAS